MDCRKGSVCVLTHDPWMSWLEGVLTRRGDERTGVAIARAHELWGGSTTGCLGGAPSS